MQYVHAPLLSLGRSFLLDVRSTGQEIDIYGNLTASSWVKVHEGCPIELDAVGSEVHLSFGDSSAQDVEMVIDTESFRELVQRGIEALRELDAEADAEERSLRRSNAAVADESAGNDHSSTD